MDGVLFVTVEDQCRSYFISETPDFEPMLIFLGYLYLLD